ncbi:unnamed protein product [Chrysodeixis includens]|uniref:Uncharacterized protein n=1 Tax=Chrysodeixis includens TaxID=689277 RepID=A0A9N8L055_CHRIL|nr:unnamed protein product [Chrysodeixis includens]
MSSELRKRLASIASVISQNQRSTSLAEPVADLTNTDDHSIRGSGDRINPRTEAPVPNRIIPTLFLFPALIIVTQRKFSWTIRCRVVDRRRVELLPATTTGPSSAAYDQGYGICCRIHQKEKVHPKKTYCEIINDLVVLMRGSGHQMASVTFTDFIGENEMGPDWHRLIYSPYARALKSPRLYPALPASPRTPLLYPRRGELTFPGATPALQDAR